MRHTAEVKTMNNAARWLNKVPEVTLSFWVIKIMSTTVGETGADYLAVDAGFGAGPTSLGMAMLLAVTLFCQLRTRACTPWLYWLNVVLRRLGGSAVPVLGNGVVSLDLVCKQASAAAHHAVALSSHEFALLQALLVRPGAILSRSELEERLYGWGNEVESNAVEFLIHALRRKLGSHVIRNVRGLGWMVSINA